EVNLHDSTRIGIRVVPFGGRPAVHYYFALIGCTGSYDSPGAHAKRKYATVADLFNQVVVGRRQVFTPHGAMVLGPVDDFLWMFNAHAEGERLWLREPPLAVEQLKQVACRMSR